MDIITTPIAWVLKQLSILLGGQYLFAILIFAVLIELILLPIAISQQKKSIKQARMRPKEMAIRKKYAGRTDKPTQMKMNQEIQELYQKEGYNPMGGCLPLLIQLPVLIALFNVVNDPLTYLSGFSPNAISQIGAIIGPDAVGGMGTMGYLNYLTAPNAAEAFANVEGFAGSYIPNLNVFGIFDMSKTPWECIQNWDTALTTVAGWITVLIPVLTFVSYFFSMKMTRKLSYQPLNDGSKGALGCSPKLMDVCLPLISVFFAFRYAAALGIYWIFKSLLDLLKRVILAKVMPLPKFSEEDYKSAELEVSEEDEKKGKKGKSGRVVRSLHYIDDEDFEDTAERAKAFKEAYEAQEEEDKRRAEENRSRFGAPKMKEDRRHEMKDDLKVEVPEEESAPESEPEESEDNSNKDE